MGTGDTADALRDYLEGAPAAAGRLLERLRTRIVLWVSTRLSPALRAQVRSKLFPEFGLDVREQDGSAFCDKSPGGGCADAGGRSGNKRCMSGKHSFRHLDPPF